MLDVITLRQLGSHPERERGEEEEQRTTYSFHLPVLSSVLLRLATCCLLACLLRVRREGPVG